MRKTGGTDGLLRRTYPYRCSVAVDAGCNQRQGSPKLHDRAGTDEKLSRIYLYVKLATAL